MLEATDNITEHARGFWDDVLRAPLEAETQFHLARFPTLIDAMVKRLAAAKQEEAARKGDLVKRHISHALDFDVPSAPQPGITFNEAGMTHVYLPRMGSFLAFIFARGATSVTADIESQLRQDAHLADAVTEACGAERQSHVEERLRIEHAHRQISEVMATFSSEGRFELDGADKNQNCRQACAQAGLPLEVKMSPHNKQSEERDAKKEEEELDRKFKING